MSCIHAIPWGGKTFFYANVLQGWSKNFIHPFYIFLQHNMITISFSIWSLYDLFYPFMESFVSDDPTRDMLRQTADSLKEWTTSLNTNSNGK